MTESPTGRTTESMRALLGEPARMVIEACERPAPGPDEAVIKIARVGVRGSDTHGFGPCVPPEPGRSAGLGHEPSGVVVEVGRGLASRPAPPSTRGRPTSPGASARSSGATARTWSSGPPGRRPRSSSASRSSSATGGSWSSARCRGRRPSPCLKINREMTIQTVFRSCNSCPTTIALMRSGAVNVSSLVDRHFDHADIQPAFELAADEPDEFTKAVVVDADLT